MDRIDDVIIYPLTPRDDLESTDEYLEYEKRLSFVFENSNDLWNVAISGDYGVGKSSILHTYSKKKNKNFLYISLIDFSKQLYRESNSPPKKQNKETDEERSNQINQLDANLFRQILIYCSKDDLPKFRYNIVPEDGKISGKCILICSYIAILLCTLFSRYISEYVHLLGFDFYGYGCLSLYLICILMTVIVFGVGINHFFKYGRIKDIELKAEPENLKATVDISMTAEAVLEKYRFDLIYVIEKLSASYDAIVFEDMDRLDTQICTTIFSQLREINISVNNKIRIKSRNTSVPSMKFIYVVNDGLLAQLDRTKFFDYIMSVIPTLGNLNAKDKFELEILNRMSIRLTCEEKEKILSVVDMCPDLADYRVLNQIKNDYNLFCSVQKNQNTDFNDYPRLLAFVIYKVLCPGDYHLIRTNESFIFSSENLFDKRVWTSRGDKMSNYQAVKKLKENPTPLLDASCLKFVGYAKEERKKIIREALLHDETKRKIKILQSNTLLCIEVLDSESSLDAVNKMISGIENEIVLCILDYYQILPDAIKTALLKTSKKHKNSEFIENLDAVLSQLSIRLPWDTKISLYVFALRYCVNMGYTEIELRWFYSIDHKLVTECLKELKEDDNNTFNFVYSGCSQAQKENYNNSLSTV